MKSPFKSLRAGALFLFGLLASTLPAACQPRVNSLLTPGGTGLTTKPCSLEFEDGPKKGKEAVVALFTFDGPEVGPEWACDRLFEQEIVMTLTRMARETGRSLTLVDPARVRKYRDNSPYWYYRHPREWGRQLKADLVIRVSVEKVSFSRSELPGVQNQCRSELTVEVYDVDAGKVKPKYHFTAPFVHSNPNKELDPSTLDFDSFKRQSLHQLAVEVCGKLLAPEASP